jgi:hypothetical protein
MAMCKFFKNMTPFSQGFLTNS